MIKCVKTALLTCLLSGSLASAQDIHPLMSSTYWIKAGAFFAAHEFDASASVSAAGIEREIDFEKTFALDDHPELFMAELGWQFGEKWGFGLQYFGSQRKANRVIEETFEWEDLTYNAGVSIRAGTEINITRLFFSREFLSGGRHSLRVGAGIHWLDLSASVAGEATLNDISTEFRKSVVTASAPVPNIGAGYLFSPSKRWLLGVRVDWLSADVSDISGRIWNVAGSANYQLTKKLGVGLNYQFFEINGSTASSNWRGDIRMRFRGPFLYLTGAW
jgi:hypothetical protein